MRIPISKQFSLNELTKRIYGKPVLLTLRRDVMLPTVMKEEIREAYSYCLHYSAAFDHKIKKNGYVITEKEIKTLMDWNAMANHYCMFLYIADGYKGELKKRFKDKIESDIAAAKKGLKGENGFPVLRRTLLKLVGFDPRWLYESWIKDEINEAFDVSDLGFFSTLGDVIGAKSKKFTRETVHSPAGKKVLEYLEDLSVLHEPTMVPPRANSISFLKKHKSAEEIKDGKDLLKLLMRRDPPLGVRYTPKTLGTFLRRHKLYFGSKLEMIGYLKDIRKEQNKKENRQKVAWLFVILHYLKRKYPA